VNCVVCRYETLGYLAAYDAVLNCDYAFVAYKEVERNGEWRVRINSLQTPGCVFEPTAIHRKARETSAQGRPWFQWGYCFSASLGDPRQIQFRVCVSNGQPREIEMYVQLRKFDGSADEAQSVRFLWPAA
jgi:hypothetical protein